MFMCTLYTGSLCLVQCRVFLPKEGENHKTRDEELSLNLFVQQKKKKKTMCFKIID